MVKLARRMREGGGAIQKRTADTGAMHNPEDTGAGCTGLHTERGKLPYLPRVKTIVKFISSDSHSIRCKPSDIEPLSWGGFDSTRGSIQGLKDKTVGK